MSKAPTIFYDQAHDTEARFVRPLLISLFLSDGIINDFEDEFSERVQIIVKLIAVECGGRFVVFRRIPIMKNPLDSGAQRLDVFLGSQPVLGKALLTQETIEICLRLSPGRGRQRLKKLPYPNGQKRSVVSERNVAKRMVESLELPVSELFEGGRDIFSPW